MNIILRAMSVVEIVVPSVLEGAPAPVDRVWAGIPHSQHSQQSVSVPVVGDYLQMLRKG